MTMMTLRSKHVTLNDTYIVVLTVYLHNNNYWWFVKLMSKVVSEDGQRVRHVKLMSQVVSEDGQRVRHMQVTTRVPKAQTVFLVCPIY